MWAPKTSIRHAISVLTQSSQDAAKVHDELMAAERAVSGACEIASQAETAAKQLPRRQTLASRTAPFSMTPIRTLLKAAAVTLIGLSTGVAPAQTSQGRLGADVDSLLDYARTNNADYAAMRFEAVAAVERVQPAGALPDPMLTTELRDITNGGQSSPTLAPWRVGSTRYVITQSFPWWGKRDLRREAAASGATEAQARTSSMWNELAMRIKSTHALRYRVGQSIALFEDIAGLLNRLEQISRSRYAGGLVPVADVIRAQAERTMLEGEVVMLKADERTLRAQLNALLARAPDADLADPVRLRPLPAPEQIGVARLLERARGNNPDVAIEAARVSAAEKNRDLTYRNRYPDFSVSVAPVQMGRRIGEWEVMFEVNIPLQQTSRRHQERETEAMWSAARSRHAAALQRLGGDVGTALAGFEGARQTELLTSTTLVPQAQVALDAALAAYETGRVDFTTLLEAQRQLRQARLNALRAQAESRMRLAEIERLIGEDL